MGKLFDRLNRKKEKDVKMLGKFVSIYCRENHPTPEKSTLPVKDERLLALLKGTNLLLCQDCQKLLSHGLAKLMLCPYDPKPMCKKCKTHCYAPGYRQKMQNVMRFSGLYLVKHGRLDMMIHYFF
ncbi:MAG: nitrous oxide-stimulated promoter family protein [Dehalococcoidia bacterium]|nr:nitrous oxide-stimulated promoter family protein [Dehalococcoidia bacterium]